MGDIYDDTIWVQSKLLFSKEFYLGGGDDIQKTGMCIFILAGDVHCGYRLTAHFSHPQAGLFWIVRWKRHLTNKQRYKVVRVGGWERTLSSPSQLRDSAEQVVWGYLLSLTMSNTASGPPLLLWCSWGLCWAGGVGTCTFHSIRWPSWYTEIPRVPEINVF